MYYTLINNNKQIKTYTLSESDLVDEEKTIIISEDVAQEEKVTVSNLKEQHAQKLEQIENCKVEADKLVDKITAINDDEGIALTIKDIPVKISTK